MSTMPKLRPKIFDVIVVGSGVAAHAFLEEAVREKFDGSILWVSAPGQLTPCSLRSTALVARQGVRRGVSPLGDLLVEGCKRFSQWCARVSPAGVEPLINWYWPRPSHPSDKEYLIRRFGAAEYSEKGWIVDAPVFFPFLGQRLSGLLDLQREEALVTALRENGDHVELQTWRGEKWRGKQVLLATGAHGRLFPLSADAVPQGQAVPGHFLVWEGVDWPHPTTRWKVGPWNLIYRSKQRTLWPGSSVEKDGITAPRIQQFRPLWREMNRLFENLPPLDQARVITGIRHRGEGRRPYAGLLPGHTRTYRLTGLYKSGFTLAWSLAPRVWREMGQV